MKKTNKRIFWGLFIVTILAAMFFLGGKIINLALKQYYLLEYENIVAEVSNEYDIEPELILAIIHTESRFDEKALSSKGAIGLMQITPDTFEWILQKDEKDEDIDVNMLYDARTNIEYGTIILKNHLQEFSDLETALCAYNAGRTNVKKWLDNDEYSKDGKTIDKTPFEETNNYVKKVLKAKDMYKKLYFEEKEN